MARSQRARRADTSDTGVTSKPLVLIRAGCGTVLHVLRLFRNEDDAAVQAASLSEGVRARSARAAAMVPSAV